MVSENPPGAISTGCDTTLESVVKLTRTGIFDVHHVPLPVFEQDADPANRDAMTLEEQHAALEPPKTIVVRFGAMRLIGEYTQAGSIKPGCGSKLIARTHRGLEVVEMLTTTCTNAGCGKSVTQERDA